MPGNLFPLRGVSHWEIYLILSVWTSADFFYLLLLRPTSLYGKPSKPMWQNLCSPEWEASSKMSMSYEGAYTTRMKQRKEKSISFSAPALQEHPFILPVPKAVYLQEGEQNIYAVILHTHSTHFLLSWNLPKDHLHWWHSFYGLQQALDQMNPAQYQHLRPQVGTSSKIFSKNFLLT